jgi:hypothetical protein
VEVVLTRGAVAPWTSGAQSPSNSLRTEQCSAIMNLVPGHLSIRVPRSRPYHRSHARSCWAGCGGFLVWRPIRHVVEQALPSTPPLHCRGYMELHDDDGGHGGSEAGRAEVQRMLSRIVSNPSP